MKKKTMKTLLCVLMMAVMVTMTSVTAFAAGDVATAIENTWTAAQTQIKSVVNNVVFPVIDMILAILFFVKLGTAYFDYRKHGQFEFTAPAILFACLIFRVFCGRSNRRAAHRCCKRSFRHRTYRRRFHQADEQHQPKACGGGKVATRQCRRRAVLELVWL